MEVSRLRSGRLSEKKNYPFTLLHGPLSARGERQSHPLAGQAQACGRPTQVEGPGESCDEDDEEVGVDVLEELADEPGTSNGISFERMPSILLPFLMRCGF